MSTAIIITFGSRGDVEPQLSLASSLAKDPYWSQICVFLQPDFEYLVPKDPKIRIEIMEMSLGELFAALATVPFFKSQAKSEKDITDVTAKASHQATENIAKVTSSFFKSFGSTLLNLAQDMNADVIVGTMSSELYCIAVGEKLSIPVAIIHLQPFSPTSYFCCPHVGTDAAKVSAKIMKQIVLGGLAGDEKETVPGPEIAKENRESFKIITRIWFEQQCKDLNKFREELDLRAMLVDDLLAAEEGQVENVRIVAAYSPQLVPLPDDSGHYLYQSGPLADSYLPKGWDPLIECPDLVTFLIRGEAPVCVSFGSMTSLGNSRHVTRTVLSALRSVGIERAVLLPGQADLGIHNLDATDKELIEWAKDRVLEPKGNVQYAWLLPQCRLLVTHGGAGSVSSGLRAGVPLVVAPFGFDQFFWGSIVAEFKLGTMVGANFITLSAEKLESGIRQALAPNIFENSQKYKTRASKGPSGAEESAEILKMLAGKQLESRVNYCLSS